MRIPASGKFEDLKQLGGDFGNGHMELGFLHQKVPSPALVRQTGTPLCLSFMGRRKILLKPRKRIKILLRTRETDEARKTALGQLDTPCSINLNVRSNALTRF